MIDEGTLWKNWSGSLKFRPEHILEPESEEEICEIIYKAGKNNKKVRVAGAGHSSTPLLKTDDILIYLKHFNGVESPDKNNKTAWVPSGMTVKEAGSDLYRYGLAMHNTGDVDVQKLAGAIGTGTHGTGVNLQNLSAMLIGVKLVNGQGEIKEFDSINHPEIMRALRVSLGSCGIFLKMKLQLQDSYILQRKEWCITVDQCLKNLNDYKLNRNFDFYWYPRTDKIKIRIMNEEGVNMPDIPFGSLEMESIGPGHEILPRDRALKFDEMEYALPAEKAQDCFLEIRNLILKKFRKDIAWRLLFRTIKKDDTYLSCMNGRETVTISLHHNAGLPFWTFFKAIEPIFLKYEGRPHWAKKHTLIHEELHSMYPDWNKFLEVRDILDPRKIFITRYLQEILGI